MMGSNVLQLASALGMDHTVGDQIRTNEPLQEREDEYDTKTKVLSKIYDLKEALEEISFGDCKLGDLGTLGYKTKIGQDTRRGCKEMVQWRGSVEHATQEAWEEQRINPELRAFTQPYVEQVRDKTFSLETYIPIWLEGWHRQEEEFYNTSREDISLHYFGMPLVETLVPLFNRVPTAGNDESESGPSALAVSESDDEGDYSFPHPLSIC